MGVQAGYREEGRRAPEQPRPLFPRQPPAPNYTGTWMGWRWVNGRPTERAPAVER